MKKKKKVIKKTTSKKAVAKKPAVKKAVVKKPVEVKPVIKYTWDIISIDTYDHPENGTDLINQIVYEITGTWTKGSIKKTGSTSGAIAVDFNKDDKFSTGAFQQFTKKQLVDYIKRKISDRHLEAMIDIINKEFLPAKKTVTEFSWNK
jgi:hypothetical protein|tara:strand:- start:7363 stop:7806 length:444 start_codon:yes stop_codon:yes gene_type:complete